MILWSASRSRGPDETSFHGVSRCGKMGLPALLGGIWLCRCGSSRQPATRRRTVRCSPRCSLSSPAAAPPHHPRVRRQPLSTPPPPPPAALSSAAAARVRYLTAGFSPLRLVRHSSAPHTLRHRPRRPPQLDPRNAGRDLPHRPSLGRSEAASGLCRSGRSRWCALGRRQCLELWHGPFCRTSAAGPAAGSSSSPLQSRRQASWMARMTGTTWTTLMRAKSTCPRERTASKKEMTIRRRTTVLLVLLVPAQGWCACHRPIQKKRRRWELWGLMPVVDQRRELIALMPPQSLPETGADLIRRSGPR